MAPQHYGEPVTDLLTKEPLAQGLTRANPSQH